MNAIIQTQLDRVELALNTLVSSIESYNPSVPAAISLLAVDTELRKGVTKLAQHQAHYARILRLRSLLDAQAQQKKSTLTLLAETRNNLLSAPATIFPEKSRNVSYAELLDYARRTSRYTVPPTGRETPPSSDAVDEANASVDIVPAVNGIGDAVIEAGEANAIANGGVSQGRVGKGVGEKSLEPADVQWLNPLAHIPFSPWPTEEIIKRGALGQIHVMLEQGADPGDGEASTEELRQDERGIGEADVQRDKSGLEVPGEDREGTFTAEGRMGEAQRRREKPKVFKGLDLDEDSDDE
ncbi:MAG: hypothetical protein Q9184_005273 [Pyrenodesmia sp. 2 TL-2023]